MNTTTQERLHATAEAFIDSCRADFDSKHEHLDPDQRKAAWAYDRDNFLRLSSSRVDTWLASVPSLYRTASLDSLTPSQQPQKLREFMTSGVRNLMLAGPVGTGKSYAAWSVCHQATAMNLWVVPYSTPRLLVDMRPEGDPQAFGRACRAHVLFLDDLGAARPTDWAIEQMFSIADERANHQRRTIITTNASFDGLKSLWGQPTMDRFHDKSTHVVMAGPSRRGAA